MILKQMTGSLGYWSDLASGITKCNQVIVDLGGEEEDVTAPIRAVRAFYHFILMDSYGACSNIRSCSRCR